MREGNDIVRTKSIFLFHGHGDSHSCCGERFSTAFIEVLFRGCFMVTCIEFRLLVSTSSDRFLSGGQKILLAYDLSECTEHHSD